MKTPLKIATGWGFTYTVAHALAHALRNEYDVECAAPQDLGRHALEWRPLQSDGQFPAYDFGLRRLLERETGPSTVIGWSMGGLIALQAALAEPERVSRLILVGSTARFCSTRQYPHGKSPATLRALTRSVRKDPAAALAEFSALCSTPNAVLPDLASAAATSEPNAMDHLLSGLAYLQATDLRESLGGIRCPTLILHGSEDAVIPPGAAEDVAAGIPGSVIRVFPGIGHDLLVRAPADVAGAILSAR